MLEWKPRLVIALFAAAALAQLLGAFKGIVPANHGWSNLNNHGW